MKILIVEDDVNYRYAIKSLLVNSKIKYESCNEAINGRHALDLIKKDIPNVILTDISMPEMNGIELIKSVKRKYPYIYIVVLSAYDDFQFVKDALKHGAKDYILKYEMSDKLLQSKFEDISDFFEKEIEQRKDREFISNYKDEFFEEFLKKIINGKVYDSEKIERNLKLKFQGLDLEMFVLCEIQILNNSLYSKYKAEFSEIINNTLGENRRIKYILLDSNIQLLLGNFSGKSNLLDRKEGLKTILKKIQQKSEQQLCLSVAVSISDFFSEPNEISIQYQKINQTLKQKYYHIESCLLESTFQLKESVLVRCNGYYKKLIIGIKNLDDEEVIENLKFIFLFFVEQQPDVSYLIKMYNNFVADFLSILHSLELNIDDVFDSDYLPFSMYDFAGNIFELKTGIIDLYNNLKLKRKTQEQKYRKEIREVVEFIELNYQKEITLEGIANCFGYSPNYLCSLFKNETGERLFRYINKIRVHKAIKLIQTTNMKVYEIADKAGFKNASYFSQTFKLITGKSISEFKKQV